MCSLIPIEKFPFPSNHLEDTPRKSRIRGIAMVTKFAGAGATYGSGQPQNVPFFLQNQTMWVAITSVLERVEPAK